MLDTTARPGSIDDHLDALTWPVPEPLTRPQALWTHPEPHDQTAPATDPPHPAPAPRPHHEHARLVKPQIKHTSTRFVVGKVVGDRLFPVAIHNADPEQLDWRVDYDSLTYQHIEFPADVTTGIRRYLTTAGLAFGAFDFVMDHAGELWWMECNPNGEWGWLTECIDVPLADALAELLLGKSAL